tara:strand:+ start:49 stop:333 length:285 start_codon:yes stop_codon:yes gene_type:complete
MSDPELDLLNRAREHARFLEEYAEMDGTEWGEACHMLCRLVGRFDMFSSDFQQTVFTELDEWVSYVKENVTIETTTETETVTREIKELHWWNDE